MKDVSLRRIAFSFSGLGEAAWFFRVRPANTSKEIAAMQRKTCMLLPSRGVVLLTYGLRPGQDCDEKPGKKAQVVKRKTDEALIRKQAADFVRAFNKGDAKTLAALWTEEGEYIDDDGTTYRGRAAIEEVYADFF